MSGQNIAIQLAALQHDAIVELFELDATIVGAGVYYFHAGTNRLGGSVTWQTVVYEHMPLEVEGFDVAGDGPQPRPALRVSNVLGLVGALVRQYKGLKGAKLTRRRTLAKYLDAANFPGGVNASADPASHYPDEVWYLDRVASRDRALVAYELASPMDVAGVMLPRRQVRHGVCPWIYRGPDCGYTGGAVAKADDTPTATLALDACGKRLASCRLRSWPNNELSFGGFPGAGVVRNV